MPPGGAFYQADQGGGEKFGKVGNVTPDTIQSHAGRQFERGSDFAKSRKKLAKWKRNPNSAQVFREMGGTE